MNRKPFNGPLVAGAVLFAIPCFGQMTVQSFGPATWNPDPNVIDATTGMTGATFETFEDLALDPNLSVRYNSGAPTTVVTFDELTDPRWDGTVGFSLVLPGTPVTTCMAQRLEIVLAQPASRIGFGISLMELGSGAPSPNPKLIVNGTELAEFAALPNYADGGLERNVYVVVTASPGTPISSFGIANPGNCDRVQMDRIGWFPCALAITSQPASRVVAVGTTTTFGVAATGTAPLAYQWRKDSVALVDSGSIAGALTPTLTISPVANPDAGTYDCIVSSACSDLTSSAAMLSVSPDCNGNGVPDEQETSPGCNDCLAGPYTNPANGHVYFILPSMTWTESEAAAVDLGGHLVTINDIAEDQWVFQKFGAVGGQSRKLWIGLTDYVQEGSWHWISGETATYTHWYPGEPNNIDNEDYASILGPSDDSAGRWNDLPNTPVYQLFGVVEIVPKADCNLNSIPDDCELAGHDCNNNTILDECEVGPPPDCADCLSGPVIYPTTGHAYYLLQPTTWTQSEATARKLRGHLVTISNAAENDWVYETFGGASRHLWIGFNDAIQEGTFAWANNASDSYTNWAPGEPSEGCCAGEDYVHMFSGDHTQARQWNDSADIGYFVPHGELHFGVVEVGIVSDCNANGIPDSCELTASDCNANATPDACDIASGVEADCNANGTPDACELTPQTDCNNNAILDACESAPVAFGQPATYPAGDYPAGIVVADFNTDGTPDLAVVDNYASTVSILPGAATGLFQPPTTQPTGQAPFGLATADIDSDNKPDLVSANESAGTVSVLRNLGGGAFAHHTDYPTGAGCFAVALADLNGDNQPDIATANSAANTVSILINAGGGGFGSASNTPVAASPQFIAIADLDADGNRDLVVVNSGPDKLSILKNNGLGLFASPVLYNTGPDPTSVAIADLDGDSKPDLAVTNLSGNSLSIFHSAGAGAFTLAATIPSGGTFPSHVIAGDINGDTYPDLLVTNSSSNNFTIHVNTGIGSFAAPVSIAVAANPLSVVAAALHGGPMLDIAVACAAADSVSILRNYLTTPPPADCNLDAIPDTCQTPDFYLSNNLCASFTIAQPASLGFTEDGPAANYPCAANRNFRLFAGRADAGSNKIWRIRKDCTQAAFGSVLANPSSVLIDTHGYYAGGCTSPNNTLVGGRSGSDDIISVLNNTTGAVCEQLIDNTIHGIGQMALAPDGRLYLGSIDGDCLMLFSKGVVAPLFCYPGRSLRAVAIGPDGNIYSAGAIDGILRLLDPDGVVLNPNAASCLQGVVALAFAKPGVFHANLYAACGAPANRVVEIDLATHETRPFMSNIPVGGIAFDPEGFMHLSIPGENRVLKLGARHPGDMNGDGQVTTQDLPGFIAAALLLPTAPLPIATADMNNDACVNGKDIHQFTAAIAP